MWNRLLNSVEVLAALLAFSCVTFAQTYGTPGYSPGAWKPDELPKELSKPKPFNAHDLSGVWSTPTTAGYFERHSLNDKWMDSQGQESPAADEIRRFASADDGLGQGEIRCQQGELRPSSG